METFHSLTGKDAGEWFCTADPVGKRLGSGGGTVWLMKEAQSPEVLSPEVLSNSPSRGELWRQGPSLEGRVGEGLWTPSIIIHAGGCSRRIPAYAPSGKVLIPMPPCNGKRGQTLLDLQTGLFERIMRQAPEGLHTLIASGDVLITAQSVPHIPDADVVCLGMVEEPELMQNHGVFAIRRDKPEELDFMLQKPSVARMGELEETHELLMDIGLWLLSDRAVERLETLASDDEGNICF
ncbi:MAG: bifunctional fucokinase/L-fucose-1-P-guanylyltransferase, partial [Bacteroidaceae bacterium]|nr:bifunctional fucokinase/L-fucose-1-P-guanylyltransferase [Bacteroidaceae bacterium]